ncbi:MAG: GIY-YIG nuclease family protein [Patescibacteria group bacterium]
MALPQKTPTQTVKTLTTRPGCYLYKDAWGKVIYVGKAKNLQRRVRQYFGKKDTLNAKTQLLVKQIVTIDTIPTDSEFDAILLEAALIRAHQPKYNIIARDDKSPLYIAITKQEALPRILFERKHTIDATGSPFQRALIIGPFQSNRIIRQLLRSIRRIVPYCLQKKRDGHACFYTHIGLCNPCPSVISKMPDSPWVRQAKKQYRRNILRVALLLTGKSYSVRLALEKEMMNYAASLAFEKAADIQRQLNALDMLLVHSFDPMIYVDHTSLPDDQGSTRLDELILVLKKKGVIIPSLGRIECIDISNISGVWATGSLVVFTKGVPDSREYRRFRIKLSGIPNDVAMIREVILRRFRHPEWPTPDLLVVDGGKPQVTAAQQSLSPNIPIIGLAKRYEEIVIPNGSEFTIVRLARSNPALQLIQHIRDEAHRFAKHYHTHLRSSYEFVTMKRKS